MFRKIKALGHHCGVIHSDKSQIERQEILEKFRQRKIKILIATDLACRGLNVKKIKTVINYDTAFNLNAHVHRIGRTGRCDEQGIAYTILMKDSKKDINFSRILANNLKKYKQFIPDSLLTLAGIKKTNLEVSHKKENSEEKKRSMIHLTGNISIVKNNFINTFKSSTGKKFLT